VLIRYATTGLSGKGLPIVTIIIRYGSVDGTCQICHNGTMWQRAGDKKLLLQVLIRYATTGLSSKRLSTVAIIIRYGSIEETSLTSHNGTKAKSCLQ